MHQVVVVFKTTGVRTPHTHGDHGRRKDDTPREIASRLSCRSLQLHRHHHRAI
jgi:hypothetical protein